MRLAVGNANVVALPAAYLIGATVDQARMKQEHQRQVGETAERLKFN
jgi:hypothetical protein